jgi:DNA mismatch repair protein MutS
VGNFRVSIKETPGGIVFLRKVEPGAADKSYGIEVARLAGLPAEVIARAREVLALHEGVERNAGAGIAASAPAETVQLSMFTPLSQQIVDRLRQLEVNKLTPLEALNLLSDLQKQLN